MTTQYFSEYTSIPLGSGTDKVDGAKGQEKPGFKAGSGNKSGKLGDAVFNAYLPLHAGDQYQDASTRLAARRRLLAEAQRDGSAKAEPRAFKPASPSKSLRAPHSGDEFGCLSAHIEHIPDPARIIAQKAEKSLQAKPIYTSPCKLGSYGVNNTTLSQRKGPSGVAGEYEYRSDPYVQPRQHSKQGAGVSQSAFKPAATARNSVFSAYENMAVGEPKSSEKKHTGPAFKPASTCTNKALNPPAPYIASPYIDTLPKGNAEERKKYGSFKPTFNFRTTATPSVLRMNV